MIFLSLFVSLSVSVPSFADSKYLYRQRLNWVKVDDAPPKLLGKEPILHPLTTVSAEEVEAMLLSVSINKKHLLKKEVETTDVFNSWEARRLSPSMAQALSEIGPDQVVAFSVIHKRPLFILANDRLSMGFIWVTSEGIHLRFTKLFAKIAGDYEASANVDKSIRRAKTMRVTLEAHEGQKLSYESLTEVIFDPQFDFATQVAARDEQRRLEEEELLKVSPKGRKGARREAPPPPPIAPPQSEPKGASPKPATARKVEPPRSQPVEPSAERSGGVAERLRKLDQLKKEKLISNEEYESLRKKILSEI